MKICQINGNRIIPRGWTYMMNLIVTFTVLQICIVMRIWVSALACVAFVVAVVVVVVLRVFRDSCRSYRGFSRQELMLKNGLPLPSGFISLLCIPCSESFLPPPCAIFYYSALFLLIPPNVGW